jgi:NAD(P)-dependent dehydrogenase (short-subunit alcohol dehydrogenase family)
MLPADRPLAVVTGATAGLGVPLAAGLARAGHAVLLGARDPARGDRAVAAIHAAAPGAHVAHAPLDLASLRSIRAFAAAVDAPGGVARLVLNAGLMATTRRETEDGLELMLGTNAIGTLALARLLDERLRAAAAPRVVVQSSEAHRHGTVDPADPHRRHGFRAVPAYNASKLAGHVLAAELDRRTPYPVVVAQPGWVRTELGREVAAGGRLQRAMLAAGDRLIGQSPAQGARAALRAALDADVPGAATGRYVTPGRFGRLRGAPVVADADPAVLDRALAAALWVEVDALLARATPAARAA